MEQVRNFLADKGIPITDERIVKDDGKFYFIIKAAPKERERYNLTECEAKFGGMLLERRDDVLKEYLSNELRKKKIILDRLMSQAASNTERMDEIKHDIDIIGKGLDMYEG